MSTPDGILSCSPRKHESTTSPRVENSRWCLLRFAAEGAAVRPRVQRLAAVSAETRLRRLARFEAHVNVLRRRGCRALALRRRARRPPRRAAPGRQHVVQQLAGALI